jgi:Protein of unknown function (DUF3108)
LWARPALEVQGGLRTHSSPLAPTNSAGRKPTRGRLTLTLAALSVLVTGVHLWLGNSVLPDRLGEGANARDGRPKRIEVAFVRELAPAAPLAPTLSVVKPKPAAAPARQAVKPPEPAASAPTPEPKAEPEPPPAAPPVTPPAAAVVAEAAASAPEQLAAAAAEPPASAASAAAASVAAAASAATSAANTGGAQAESFDWPPSTRLSYTLTGTARGGPVDGQARVEWLRSGTRYQVFMEVTVGPSFAPLVTRRDSSEGEITAEGLSPRRYDQETKAVLQNPRRQTIYLDAERIRLPGGKQEARPAGVQDSVSQFVHLTWLFTTQPELLTPGKTIDIPLALPRRVQTWTYDVVGSETQYMPSGPVETVHVKPRRESAAGGDLTVEMWVAPTLQYLPVRIVIKQDAETYVDMQLNRLPQQANSPLPRSPP